MHALLNADVAGSIPVSSIIPVHELGEQAQQRHLQVGLRVGVHAVVGLHHDVAGLVPGVERRDRGDPVADARDV